MAARKETEKGQGGHDLAREIWGILYAALGLLVLIALLTRYAGRPDILGPVFGRSLSQGMLVLFGSIPALLIPVGMITLGIRQIRGTPAGLRALTIWFVLTLEICALFAIHNIRYITRGTFPFSENQFGNGVTYLLHYVFGPHPFGPYFLLVVALVISVIVLFRINVSTLLATLVRTFQTVGAMGQKGVEMVAAQREAMAQAAQEAQEQEDRERDEEAESLLEEERAAFRARKSDPVTITTYDTPVAEAQPDDDEAESAAGDDSEDADEGTQGGPGHLRRQW